MLFLLACFGVGILSWKANLGIRVIILVGICLLLAFVYFFLNKI